MNSTRRLLRSNIPSTLALLGALGLSWACGASDRKAAPSPDAGIPIAIGNDPSLELDGGGATDASRPRRDAGPWDSGAEDVGRRDTNDTRETASRLTYTGLGTAGSLNPAGDLDYYQFEGSAGDVIHVIVTSSPDKDPASINPVLTLFGPNGEELVTVDDASSDTLDPDLIYFLRASGSYVLLLQDVSTYRNETPRGGPSFAYSIRVTRFEDAAAGVLIDDEPGEDTASAHALDLLNAEGRVFGSFRDERDIDVFSLSVDTPSILNVAFLDTTVYGSTGDRGRAWIQDAAGTTIARMDRDVGQFYMSPSIPAGVSYLFIAHRPVPAGANAFYAFDATVYRENPSERGEPANNTAEGAERLTLEAGSDGRRRAFFLATLPDGDIDYFAFDVAMGEAVSVSCGSAVVGSGVLGLHGEVLDLRMTTTSSATETPLRFMAIDDAPASAGTAYLRLTKTGQDPEVHSDWVRCVVSLGAPVP